MGDFNDKDIIELAGTLGGSFYQCWSEVGKKDMVGTIEDICNSELDRQVIVVGIAKFLKALEELPEIHIALRKLGYNYDPTDDGLSELEWLVMVKKYLEGNKYIFHDSKGKKKEKR